jgi:hypothetical protein
MDNQAYYIINNEAELNTKWELIKSGKPDFIKVYLEHSEEYEKRKDDPAYFGQKGLNPRLLPAIVKKAHDDNYRVSAHVSTAGDFHNAVIAGVDEINHLPLVLIDVKDAELAAEKGITVVTTVLSHRPTGEIKNINEIHAANIKLLVSKGVKIAVGVDNGDITALNEIEGILKMNIYDNLALLKLWSEATAEAIFPGRKIGRITDGYEASFLVLGGSPIEDFRHIRDIRLRVKTGHIGELLTDCSFYLDENCKGLNINDEDIFESITSFDGNINLDFNDNTCRLFPAAAGISSYILLKFNNGMWYDKSQ